MINTAKRLFERVKARRAFARSQRGRWESSPQDAERIRVSYGLETLPAVEDKSGGGIIKLLDLAQVFPNHIRGANLLYLVSSALPPFAADMARQARRAGVKIVLNQNGVAYPAWHGRGWQVTNRPLRRVLDQADYVLYQSQFCKRSADRFLGPPAGGFEILHNAVDTSVFTPCPDIPKSECRTLLLAGSHCHPYRVQSALHTLAVLRKTGASVRLLIAGRVAWDADETRAGREARDLVKDLQLDAWVEFTGPYSQAEAVSLFRRADLLLHTKYNDPCPRVVLEAMSCGLPVVYSASGGMPELVDEASGRGVPAPQDWEQDHAPDPELLAQAVMDVLSNYDARARAARERAVRCFDVKAWIGRHRVVFAGLVSNRPSGG